MSATDRARRPRLNSSQQDALRAYLLYRRGGACVGRDKANAAAKMPGIDMEARGKYAGERDYWCHVIQCIDWLVSTLGSPREEPTGDAAK